MILRMMKIKALKKALELRLLSLSPEYMYEFFSPRTAKDIRQLLNNLDLNKLNTCLESVEPIAFFKDGYWWCDICGYRGNLRGIIYHIVKSHEFIYVDLLKKLVECYAKRL